MRTMPKSTGWLLVATCMALASSGGCVQMATLWANMTGGDPIEPKFKLTDGPLLIMIDDRGEGLIAPDAARVLHKTISDAFFDRNVNRRVVPFDEYQRVMRQVRTSNPLSIRQIGENLGAKQVLYIGIRGFATRDAPGGEYFKGQAIAAVKVLTTERKREARLWPTRAEGEIVRAETPAEPADGDRSEGEVARDLAVKLGQPIAKFFYEYRQLDK